MRVFVAGTIGAIGGPLIPELLRQGHSVLGMTSSKERAKNLERQGAEAIVADALDATSVQAQSVWLPAFARFLGAPEPPHLGEAEATAHAGEDTVYYATKLSGGHKRKGKARPWLEAEKAGMAQRIAASTLLVGQSSRLPIPPLTWRA